MSGAPTSPFLTTTLAGQRVRATLLLRRARAEGARGIGRVAGFVAIGVGVMAAIFVAGFGGGYYVRTQNAPELLYTGSSAILLGLAAALVLSSLGHAANAFFQSKDLWLWDASPAPPLARFVDRTTETAIAALPMTLVLGVVGLSGIALGGGIGAAGVLRAVVAVLLVAPLPLSTGIVLAHVGGAVLPAGRLRRLSLLVLGVLVAIGLVVFRRARVEKVLTEKGAAELLSDARATGAVGPQHAPHAHAARFFVEGDVSGLAVALAWACAALLLAYVVHRVSYTRARSLAVDESPVGLVRGSLAERALTRLVRPLPAAVRPVVEKDLLAFVRDPGQWGQLVLLLGVGVLYVVNASALREGFADLPDVARVLLPSLHVGIVTFIAAGLAARFGFSAVGLEGPAVWILDGSPLTSTNLVRAKWLASLPVVVVFPTTVGAIGGVVIGLSPSLWLWTTTFIGLQNIGIAALAVGRGAHKPLFDATSLSELAMAPGALSTMMWTTALAFAGSFGTLLAAAAQHGRAWTTTSVALGLMVMCIGVPLTATLASAFQAMLDGASALDRRRDADADRADRGAPVQRGHTATHDVDATR